jgi:hypothetical protein
MNQTITSSAIIQPSQVKLAGVTKLCNRATNKANEYLRLLNSKCSPYGELATNEANVAKTMICVELACQFHSIPYNKSELIRHSGVEQVFYIQSVNLVRNILNLKAQIHLPSLCKEFGCPGMSGAVERLLEMYKQNLMEKNKKTPGEIKKVDWNAPGYLTTAFFMTARHLKYKVDKKALLEATNCPVNQFSTILASMTALCDMKKLLVTDSMKDIQARLKEQKQKQMELEAITTKQPEENDDSEAKAEAYLESLLKNNRYMQHAQTTTNQKAITQFIRPNATPITDNSSSNAENATTTTTEANKTTTTTPASTDNSGKKRKLSELESNTITARQQLQLQPKKKKKKILLDCTSAIFDNA